MNWTATLVTLAALASVGAAVEQRRPSPAVAYVSMQQISTHADSPKAAVVKFEALRKQKAEEIAAKQREVEATHLQWVNAGGMFESSKRKQLHDQEERQRQELQKTSQQAQADLQNLQHQLQNDVRQKIYAILDDIAKRRGLDVVLNQDTAVLWAPPGADLTLEVVARLNESK